MKTDLKKTNAETMAITRNIREFDKDTDNIYESVVIMSKRADQISLEIKDEMQKEIQEVAPATDSLEEVFENREQIEIAKQYERLPKPTSMAIKEFEDGKIHFKLNNPQEEGNA
ncbi:MAG: DNA-directed RNA polymerase subunit omega [Bacteroidales bacterium]|nr:DNA-directed RNA polymerase subunit omega [Bacteroidales bacterium]